MTLNTIYSYVVVYSETLAARGEYVVIFSQFIGSSCCCCLKKNRRVVVVSHIQRIGCQPEKNYFTRWLVANPARGLLNREKNEKKSLAVKISGV